MTKVNDILNYMDSWCPISSKESWDNVGLLVGIGTNEVTKVLVTLDITAPVIDEAVSLGAQLIVSHHPVIFQPIHSVTADDIYGARVLKLLQNNISAICMHTNLDFAPGGVEDVLAKALDMQNIQTLNGSIEGRVGYVNPVALKDYLHVLTSQLSSGGLRYYDDGKPVHKICTCCGAGSDCLELAVRCGCDTFITGDLKYFSFIEAAHYGINLIDAGHYPTENMIVAEIAQRLTAAFNNVHIIQSTSSRENISYYTTAL